MNTMDVIKVRVDKDTVLPIQEFLKLQNLPATHKKIQRALEKLYFFNEQQKEPLFHFPKIGSEFMPLTIDCYRITDSKEHNACYKPGLHVVEFSKWVLEASDHSLLKTLAHELKHAEQDVPSIQNIQNNALKYHQLAFLQEAQAFAFGRYVAWLDGEKDPEYDAIKKKKQNIRVAHARALKQELRRLFHSVYKDRFDHWRLISPDDTGLERIPKEFRFPCDLMPILRKTPRKAHAPDIVLKKQLQKKEFINELRKNPNQLVPIEYTPQEAQDIAYLLSAALFREGFSKEHREQDMLLLEILLKLKDTKGYYLLYPHVIDSAMRNFPLTKGKENEYTKALDAFSKGELSREDLLNFVHQYNEVSRSKIPTVSLLDVDPQKYTLPKQGPIKDFIRKQSQPLNNWVESELCDNGFIRQNGYDREGRLKFLATYDDTGHKCDIHYFLNEQEQEKMPEWIARENWLLPPYHDDPWYCQTLYNKKDNTWRTSIYRWDCKKDRPGKFLYGTITDDKGRSKNCDEQGREIVERPSIMKAICEKILKKR